MAPGESCPSGSEITTDTRCREAADWYLALSLNPQRSFQYIVLQGVPYQCSAQCCGGGQFSDDTFHFNAFAESDNSRQSEFARICENNN